MSSKNYIASYCHIKNETIALDGNVVFEQSDAENFSTFIKAAYKQFETKYPKFFKMDDLSKLAFLGADLLLKDVEADLEETERDIAIVFSNRASSLETDRTHQKSIQNKEAYFPSPAVFVYTLPNICIGEISIKHKLYSENSFFIFDNFNASHLYTYTNSLLATEKAEKVLCGWVDYDADHYEAFLYLVDKEGAIEHTEETIIKLYNT